MGDGMSPKPVRFGPTPPTALAPTFSLTPPRVCHTSVRSRNLASVASSGPPRTDRSAKRPSVVSASTFLTLPFTLMPSTVVWVRSSHHPPCGLRLHAHLRARPLRAHLPGRHFRPPGCHGWMLRCPLWPPWSRVRRRAARRHPHDAAQGLPSHQGVLRFHLCPPCRYRWQGLPPVHLRSLERHER